MVDGATNGAPHLLDAEHLSKFYGNVVALKDISAHVNAGEGTCLLGDNGAGQSVAIARAVYFGARVLILDEPTSALGVKQAGVVLKYVLQARDRGVAVIFITHNPHHAYPVGDRFVILNRGQSLGNFPKGEIDQQELVRLMAGGRELAELEHELEAIKAEV